MAVLAEHLQHGLDAVRRAGDQQTATGLLAALPRVQAEAAVDRLQAGGQTAAIIGRLTNAWTGLYPNRKD